MHAHFSGTFKLLAKWAGQVVNLHATRCATEAKPNSKKPTLATSPEKWSGQDFNLRWPSLYITRGKDAAAVSRRSNPELPLHSGPDGIRTHAYCVSPAAPSDRRFHSLP